MFRRRRAEPPEPATVPLPARLVPIVAEAEEVGRRWGAVVATIRPGPLRDRLSELGTRVGLGVAEIRATAARVGEIESVLAALDTEEAVTAYKSAKRSAARGSAPPELPALEARFVSVQRLLNLVADAEDRLRLLDARLEAAVARAAEVALTADGGRLGELDADLDGLLGEVGALRAALVDLG